MHVFEEYQEYQEEQEGQEEQQEQQKQQKRQEQQEQQVPSLAKSDTSSRSLSLNSHSSSDHDGDDGPLPPRQRGADAAATVARSIRSSSSSRPRQRAADAATTVARSVRSRSSSRPRQRAIDAAATVDPSVRSRSSSRPRQRTADAAATADRSFRSRSTSRARQRSVSRPRSPSSRSRSRPHSSSRRRAVTARRRRCPYSGCASLDGTTLYDTPHMAKLDTYLRSKAGLRLKTDGTCAFAFEDQRFTIEITEVTGDFLFYADFGSLKALERQSRPRNFLKMLATWNKELNLRHGVVEGGEEASGLLRIDASGATGPRVAFIFYGHVGDVRDATCFGQTLDDFVDDALEYADRIHGIREQGGRKVEKIEPVSSYDTERGREQGPSSDDVAPDYDERANAKVTREATSENAKGPKRKGTAALTAGESHHSLFSSSDVYHATSKNRFQKLLGMFSKSGDEDAGAGPSFVVDDTIAEGGYLKPTIVLSRKPPDEKEDGAATGSAPSARRGLFRGGFGASFPGPHQKRTAQVAASEGDREKSFNQSIDIFDQQGPAPPDRGRLHRSEPVFDRRHTPGPSSRTNGDRPSCRRSVDGPPHRHRPTKRSSMHGEGRERGTPKGGSQRRSGRHRDAMCQSEPILAQQR